MRIQSTGWEDPLEEGVVTCSSILAWRIPWTEEPDGLQSMGLQRVEHNLATKQHILYTVYYTLNSRKKKKKKDSTISNTVDVP